MIAAFSTRRSRIVTLIFLAVSGLLAISAAVVGINDNLPGILLALLAAAAFVLAFAHPWRTIRKFLFLLLVSVFGFVVFFIMNIIFDSISQNPASSDALRNLVQSPASDAVNVVFIMLCLASLFIGIVGSIAMFIRSRRRTV